MSQYSLYAHAYNSQQAQYTAQQQDYQNLRQLTREQLIEENLKLARIQQSYEDQLLEMAQNLAIANETLQMEYHKQSKINEDLKKTQVRIQKMEGKIQQELKDKDIIVQDLTKLTQKKEQLIKQAKQQYTKQVTTQLNQTSLFSTQAASQSDKSKQSKQKASNKDKNKQSSSNHSNALFLQSEDAFKELMASSYQKNKQPVISGVQSKSNDNKKKGKNKDIQNVNSNEQEEQKREVDEFGLSGIKYDPIFK